MKKLLITLVIFLGSFIFINKVSALTAKNYCYDYNSVMLTRLKNNYDIINHIKDLSDQYNSNNIPYIVTYRNYDNVYYIDIGFLNHVANYFSLQVGAISYNNNSYYWRLSWSTSCNKSTCYSNNLSLNLSSLTESNLDTFYNNIKNRFINNSLISGQYNLHGTLGTVDNYTDTDVNLLTRVPFTVPVYSNLSIKYGKISDNQNNLNTLSVNNVPYSYDQTILTYDEYYQSTMTPTIDFSVIDNKITFNGVEYTVSKDLTINYKNANTDDYILVYKNSEDNGWTTLNGFTSKTINVTNNVTYIAQVINKNTNQVITSKTVTITGIDFFRDSLNIDTSGLAYIKINFDTSNVNINDYHFTTLSNVNNKLKEAYANKTFADDIIGNNYIDLSNERDYIEYFNNMYSFSSPFIADNFKILANYYLYYDISDKNDILTLNIDSTIPFEIEYGYLEDYNDTFITLNLKNNAGIVLFPHVSNYNGDYPFYLDNANIDIYQYDKGTIQSYFENITSSVYYISNVMYYDKSRYYLIKNNKKNEDSYISFNTRYFNYQLVTNLDDEVIIENPNFGIDDKIPSLNQANFDKDFINANFSNMSSVIKNFLTSMKDYIKYISDIIVYAFTNMNFYIKSLIITLFILIIFCTIIHISRK